MKIHFLKRINQRNKKLFIWFYSAYLLFILLFFIAGSAAYAWTYQVIKQNDIANAKSQRIQTQSEIDNIMMEVRNLYNQISSIKMLREFSTYSDIDTRNKYLHVLDLYNQCCNIKITSNYIKGFAIAYNKSKIVITNNSLEKMDLYFNSLFNDDVTKKEKLKDFIFKENYFNMTLSPVKLFYNGLLYTMIPTLFTLDTYMEKNQAVLIVYIDYNEFKKSITSEDRLENSGLIIAQKEKRLFSFGDFGNSSDVENLKQLDKQKGVYRYSSLVMPWDYYFIHNESESFKVLKEFRKQSLNYFLGLLFIAILVGALEVKISRPKILSLITSNDELRKKMEDQKPLVINTFYERLLNGNYTSSVEIFSLAKYLEYPLLNCSYCVYIIRFMIDNLFEERDREYEYGEYEKKRIQFEIILNGLIENKGDFIHCIDYNKVAVVIRSEISEPQINENLEAFETKLKEILKGNNLSNIQITRGEVVDSYDKIPFSVETALGLLRYNQGKDLIIAYADDNNSYAAPSFPIDMQMHFIQSICNGEELRSKNILRTIIKRNILESNLNEQMTKVLIIQMVSCIIMAKNRIGKLSEGLELEYQEFCQKIYNEIDIRQISWITRLTEHIAAEKAKNSQEELNSLINNIDQFIKDNYGNADFGLSSVSQAFNLTPVYISQIFKKYKHINFVDYLLQIRMKKAVELLSNPDLKIKDIVIQSGYNSNNTFGKAFRRMYNMNPSEYKEKFLNRE